MKNFIALFLLIIFIILTSSCKKEIEGCTLSFMENYDPAATENDGSCISRRERFLGTYNADQECETDSAGFELTISEVSGSSVLLMDSEQTPMIEVGIFEADLEPEDNLLVFSLKTTNIPNLGESKVSGLGTLVDNVLTIDYTRSYYISDVKVSEDCQIIAIKQ